MPFCTECGARHEDAATVCPRCGAPIAQPPDDIDDLLDPIDLAPLTDEDEPPLDYLAEMQAVCGSIASQSSALQGLTELSWSNLEANAIREQLFEALERLRGLRPPPALEGAHEDFLEGAELLARGFGELIDATEHPGAEIDRSSAERAIADATARFVRGAGAINEYMANHGYGAAAGDGADADEVTLEEVDLLTA